MKLIEIKTLSSGQEVAYLFDEQRGIVRKVSVEDYTNNHNSRNQKGEDVDYGEEIISRPPRRRARPIEDDFEDDDEEDVRNSRVRRGVAEELPVKRASIVPPGIMATMKPPGTPGAAEEVRTV